MNNISIFYKAREQFDKFEHKFGSYLEDIKQNVDVATLHINLWKGKLGKWRLKTKYYLDFGLLVSAKVEYIVLYIPFEIEDFRSEYNEFDLGRKLFNKTLLNTVFNGNTRISPCKNNSYCNVGLEDGRKFFLFSLGERNIELTNIEDANFKGVRLKIKFNGGDSEGEKNELPEDSLIYVRFRIKPKDSSKLVRSEHVSNDLIQAAFSHMDLMDFRINEQRNLDAKIVEEMRSEGCGQLKFEEVHFFYATDFKENVDNGSCIKLDSRLMEKQQWKDYMPLCNVDNVIYIAHHWKRKFKKGDLKSLVLTFSLFFTTKYPKIEKLRLFLYICFAIIIGWIASMLVFSIDNILLLQFDSSIIKCVIIGVIIVFLLSYLFFAHYKIEWLKIHRRR